MVHEMLFVGPLVFQNKEPSYARMASSEGVRAAHAGSTPWSRTCVSYPGFILCCLSRLVLVRVGYAYACAFSGTVRFPHTEESRASPISRLGVCLERARVCVRECGVSEWGCLFVRSLLYPLLYPLKKKLVFQNNVSSNFTQNQVLVASFHSLLSFSFCLLVQVWFN